MVPKQKRRQKEEGTQEAGKNEIGSYMLTLCIFLAVSSTGPH